MFRSAVVWAVYETSLSVRTVGAGMGGTDPDPGTRWLIVAVILVAAGT